MNQRIANKQLTPNQYLREINLRFAKAEKKGIKLSYLGYFIKGKTKRLERLLKRSGYIVDVSPKLFENHPYVRIKVYNKDKLKED